MKRISAWMVLTLFCTLSVLAQNKVITVSGRVIESDSKEPAAQATVQLLALPDSTFTTGLASNNQGAFTLSKVQAGKYLLKVSYIGFKTKLIPVQLTNSAPDKKMGTISLDPDAMMLSEAVVTAEAPQVTMREDTLEYNSAAFRTPEGAMLEELIKKLPGAEIDDNGNVKINGKEVKKIMVEGKEFFGGDVKTGLKNLPVNMIDKLKTYDKKSDLARITGIDDGEEETVLDLKVKKGMNQGWFGNIDGALGTEDRYSSSLMLNRFVENNQFSVIGSANNVNDQGFSGGGGGPRFRGGNNGLTATKELGANFATQTSKLEMGGSARFNYRDADASSVNSSERFLKEGGTNSFSNSNNGNRNKNKAFNADFRLEWKPDTLTNIIFRPNVNYGKTDGLSISESGTFNQDPFGIISNPNDYLNSDEWVNNPTRDPLRDIRVNLSNNNSLSDGNSFSGDASLQVNRKLNNEGRNITLRGTFNYGNNENDQYSDSKTHYYNDNRDDNRKQYITSPTKSYDYSAQLTYSEPIAKATFLQFSYRFQYKYSNSDRRTYDLMPHAGQAWDWNLGDDLPEGYLDNYVDSLSKYAQYKYYNHDIGTSLRFIREKYQLSVGLSFQPQNTKLDYRKEEIDTVVTRSVFNFSPNIDFRYRFSKQSQLRVTYRGRASQPGMENLLDITDDSNPLNIRKGNPGLKPSFSHNVRMFYNTYNPEKQEGIMAHVNFSATQNSINNSTIYNEETGGTIVQPKNINGNWNAYGGFGYNTALKNNKKFTVNTYSDLGYNNSVSYLYNNNLQADEKNTSTNLSLSERLSGTYRNDWFEFTVNGSINYNFERNKLRSESNQEPYTFGYGASTNIFLPWDMSVSTNLTNNSRRGYRDASMNRNELVWNAQLAQNFLKGNAATVTLEVYDILKQQTNISRTLTSEIRSISEYNAINSYVMLRFSYRLNIFGNKEARSGMRQVDSMVDRVAACVAVLTEEVMEVEEGIKDAS
ncbi:hypothetical protein JCM10512_4999 [Bacteroides reticulotermitis JCM 10512]|uniref:Outer membrane protein beta-barrel domain-containing protein n=1 Tax=Bacteroides reticulotermitis JCM 10512 TaxID=1445607 RepID=W4UZV7_9BACE|nr:hypothetical protein JCM10512_4999 [Bacteroides reticulotermitis JCM 10512]